MLREQQRALTDDPDVIEKATEPQPLPTVKTPDLTPAEDLLLTLGWAESQILRADARDPHDVRSLIDQAEAAVDEVLAAPPELLDDAALTRAHLVKAHARMLAARQPTAPTDEHGSGFAAARDGDAYVCATARRPTHAILPDVSASSDPALIEVVCRELGLQRDKLLVTRSLTAIARAFVDDSYPESFASIGRILACGGFHSRSAVYRAFAGPRTTISLQTADQLHRRLLLRSLRGSARFVELAIGRSGGNRTLKCAVNVPTAGLLPIEIADLGLDPLHTLDSVIVNLVHHAGSDVSIVSSSDADVRDLLGSTQLGRNVHWTGRVSPAFVPGGALGATWRVQTNDDIISVGDAVASAAQASPDMPAILSLGADREILATMPPGSRHCYISSGPGPRRMRYDRMREDIAFLQRAERPLDDFSVERFRVVAEGHEAQYVVFTRLIILACHLPVWHLCGAGVAPEEVQADQAELDAAAERQ
jgi:hypothetical protein